MFTYTSHIITYTLSALAVGALLAQPVAAQMYKYTDPQTGRLVISNQPPPAGADVQRELGYDPGPSRFVQEHVPVSAAVRVQPTTSAQSTASVLTRRTPLTEAEWRWIHNGRVDYEVVEKLGVPAEKRSEQTWDGQGNGVQREIWIYPGDDVFPTVMVWVVQGRVRGADRQMRR